MNDPLSMTVRNSTDELFKKVFGLFFLKFAFLFQEIS